MILSVPRCARAAQHHVGLLIMVSGRSKPISPSKVTLLYYYRTKEKAKTLQFQFWSKSSISTQRRFRARFRDETVPSRNTITYFTVKYLIGWCVRIRHKSFSGRKKHVRTAEKARFIRTFVSNDPMKSHRHCGAPWAVVHHCCHQAGKGRRGGAPSCCRRMCPGCPPSMSHRDHQAAAKRLGERFIARGTSVMWSPRSPDLTPPAFRLWDQVKEGTYKHEPRDLPEIKTTVTECV